MNGFLARFLATNSGIITSGSSTSPYELASSYNGTLPYQSSKANLGKVRSFGTRLESRELSAQNHLTSEQLRTL